MKQSENSAARVNDSSQGASSQNYATTNVPADVMKDLVKQNADTVKQNAFIVMKNVGEDKEIRELCRRKQELQRTLGRKESVEAGALVLSTVVL